MKDYTMRNSTFALGAALALGLVAAPAASYAGWANRVSGDTPVVTTDSLNRVAPLGQNYRFPTKSDRVQGMPPYQAFSASPYASETAAPAPVAVPAGPDQDPVYFNSVMGSNRF
jgi:hypothetical protein